MDTEVFLLEESDYPVFAGFYPGNLSETGEDSLIYGAVKDQEPAGLAIIELLPGNDTFWFSWLYVSEKMRHQKVGIQLVYEIIRLIQRSVRVRHIQAACLNREVQAFFQKVGFEVSEGLQYCVYEAKLSGLTGTKSDAVKEIGKPIFELNEEEREQISEDLMRDPNSINYPFHPEELLPESRCLITKDGLQALLLLQEDKGELVVPFAYAKKGNGAALLGLLYTAERGLLAKLGPDTKVRMTTINERSANLVEKLLPDAEKKPLFMADMDLYFA